MGFGIDSRMEEVSVVRCCCCCWKKKNRGEEEDGDGGVERGMLIAKWIEERKKTSRKTLVGKEGLRKKKGILMAWRERKRKGV